MDLELLLRNSTDLAKQRMNIRGYGVATFAFYDVKIEAELVDSSILPIFAI